MTARFYCILIILLLFMTRSHFQMINYRCDFDNDMTGDCRFNTTPGTPAMSISTGLNPASKPFQPLSDVTSIQSPTSPNGELCKLPYIYTGGWSMYFCRRLTLTSQTCPTESGTGNCVFGKYALIRLLGSGAFDRTYTTNVLRGSSTVQCLGFYYYITDQSSNAKMQVGWRNDDTTEQIVEVTALAENKWQHRQISFTTPSPSSYEISFRTMRDAISTNFVFALDEITVFDRPCDSSPTSTVPIVTSTVIVTSENVPVSTKPTTVVLTETSRVPSDTSTQSTKTNEETSVSTTLVVQTSSKTSAVITSASSDVDERNHAVLSNSFPFGTSDRTSFFSQLRNATNQYSFLSQHMLDRSDISNL